jgi:CRP-like cAMP-binding protein
MNEPLKKILPDNRIYELLSIGNKSSLKANEYFVKEGETPLKIAYVYSGLFRYVYLNDKGDEFTKGIITEKTFY